MHVLEIVVQGLVMRRDVLLVTREIEHVVQMEDFSIVRLLLVRVVILLVITVTMEVHLHV